MGSCYFVYQMINEIMSSRMVPIRRSDQKVATRRAILNAAVDLFANEGFDGTKMRDVAERAGVKQPLIAYHFENKLGLWQQAVDEVWARLEGRILERFGGSGEALAADLVDEGEQKTSRLRRFVGAFVRAVAAEPAYIHIVIREANQNTERYRWLAERHMDQNFLGGVGVMALAESKGLIPEGLTPAHLVYILSGAVYFPFLIAADVERNVGESPFDEAFIERHIETITALLAR